MEQNRPPPRIACLGWGSLLWNPGTLPVASRWSDDGPRLPIEFRRISVDGRLTLIVDLASEPIGTYQALLDVPDLESAVAALAAREIAPSHHIGRWSPSEAHAEVCPEVLATIAAWARDHRLDGVVWTDLPPTFQERAGQPWSIEAAISYLENLPPGPVQRRAAEYIRRAPALTRTRSRRAFEERLGWTPLSE